MGLTDDIPEDALDSSTDVEGLWVSLNGFDLTECGQFEANAEVEYSGIADEPFSTITARVPISPELDDALEIVMDEEEAEKVAYQILAAVQEARQEVEKDE